MNSIDTAAQNLYLSYPEVPRASLEYANMCLRNDRHLEAESIVSKALTNQPNNLRLLNAMSRIHMKKGKYDEALTILNRCEFLSPNNVDRLVMIGQCYFEIEQYSEAKKSFLKALDLEPDCKAAIRGMGAVALSSGDINEALEFFRGTATEEELASLFNTAGVVAVKNGQYEKGVSLYAAARLPIRKPNLVSKLLYNMGLAYRKWNKLAAAEHCFEEAIHYAPDNVKAVEQLHAVKARHRGFAQNTKGFALDQPRSSLSQQNEAFKNISQNIEKMKGKISVKETPPPQVVGFLDDDD